MSTAITTTSTDLEVVDPLTKAEREEFERAEVAIGKGFKYAAALGEALSVVSEKRLYREHYPTFEDYCRDRWGVEVRKAYRLIDLSAIREDVSNWSHELAPPEREAVARELKKLPAEDRGEAWAEVVEKTGKEQPTAKEVREHVEAKLAPPTGKRVGADWIEEVARTGEAPEGLGAEQAEVVDQEEEEEKLDGDSYSTPERYVEIGRRAMGSINLDPMSNHAANEVVAADVYYTKDDDGLAQDWRGNVWLNPPYSSTLIKAAVDKLLSHWRAGEIEKAVVLTNTDSSVSWWRALAAAAAHVAFPPERINFWHPDAEPDDPRCQRNRNSQTFFFLAPIPGDLALELEEEGWLIFERAEIASLFVGAAPAQVLEYQLALEKYKRRKGEAEMLEHALKLERELLDQRGELTVSTSKLIADLASARNEVRQLLRAPQPPKAARFADVPREIVSKMVGALNKPQLIELAMLLEIDFTGHAYEISPRITAALSGEEQ